MKKKIILPLIIILLTTEIFILNCRKDFSNSAKSKKTDITVVFIPKITGNAFFESANEGAQTFAKKYGFKVSYQGNPDAVIDKQIEIVNKAIEDKADAICISSLDTTALDNVLKKAMTAGIVVTTWDSDVSSDARSIMVSQGTPAQLGRMLVEMGAKSLSERGKNIEGEIKYVWHYSQKTVTDQNSWQKAGESYIKEAYPNWVNVKKENYYSEQNPEKAIAIGEKILKTYSDIDLIICNDSTSLPGQAQAAKNLGLSAKNITITGFASPNSMRDYCKSGIVTRWGLWDCQIQGGLGCYIAWYLASGKELKVGDRLNINGVGIVEIMPNTVLDPDAYTADRSGIVLLPNRIEFTINNVDNYNF